MGHGCHDCGCPNGCECSVSLAKPHVTVKTVVIWDMCGEASIKYFIAAGDLSRLNGLYINTYTEKTPEGRKKEKLLSELSKLTYDKKGNFLQTLLDAFPVQAVRDGAQVIVAGFLP